MKILKCSLLSGIVIPAVFATSVAAAGMMSPIIRLSGSQSFPLPVAKPNTSLLQRVSCNPCAPCAATKKGHGAHDNHGGGGS